jgi:FAD:protein FMN transferase
VTPPNQQERRRPLQAGEPTLAEERFPLWGGVATVTVAEPDRLGAARRAVDQVVADIDAACGACRGDCDLARVHAAAGQPVQVGTTFHALLWTALHAAEATGGRVDPTVGTTREAWRSVVIDEPPGTVTLPPETTLDLWPTAKAFAADRAAELAAGRAKCGVLVSLGGNVAVAGPVPAAGWPARVTNGHIETRHSDNPSGQDIVLRAPGGLATRRLAVPDRPAGGGRSVPHLIDPRSVRRAHGPWLTISVAADSCVDAHMTSTAALVSGHDATDWLKSVGLAARMVHEDGWVLTIGNWPAAPGSPA